jgi:hypothetical protein
MAFTRLAHLWKSIQADHVIMDAHAWEGAAQHLQGALGRREQPGMISSAAAMGPAQQNFNRDRTYLSSTSIAVAE